MILKPKLGRVNLRAGQGTSHLILKVLELTQTIEVSDTYRPFLGTQHWVHTILDNRLMFGRADLFVESYAPQTVAWEHGHAAVGVHGPAPDLWAWVGFNEENQTLVREGRFEQVKLLCAADAGQPQVDLIRACGARCDLARLYIDMSGQTPKSPAQYVQEVQAPARALYQAGVRYFEVHNEPNLKQEGFGVNWQNGTEFGRWSLEVVRLLKPMMPLAKFGLAAMSPGHVTAERADPVKFFNQAYAVWQGDWLALHVYWQGNNVDGALASVRAFAEAHPDKVIHVTEFSNPDPAVSMDEKGRQHVDFYTRAKLLPANVGGLLLFVLDNPGFPHESIRGTNIVSIIGNR